MKSVGVLVCLYALTGLTAWAFAGQRGDVWRAALERFCLHVPVLGAARSALALSRLARALEALTSAGVLVTESWLLSARASGSPLLTRTVEAWPSLLASGQTPAELVAISGPFPDLFVSAYATGEISGQLDQQLRWLANHYEEEGFQKLRTLAVAFPMIGYALLGLWIIVYIFSMFLGYINILDGLLGQ
jgi:type II secretory pathway component PulF